MGLTVKDLAAQTDVLIAKGHTTKLTWDTYPTRNEYYLETDGKEEYFFPSNTDVEPLPDGSFNIMGTNFTGFVMQQIKYQPTVE